MKIKQLKKIIDNGGATLNAKEKAVKYLKGYQVSEKDCYKLDVNNIAEILQAINQLFEKINKDQFVGLWVDCGFVYIDISKKINALADAIKFGKEKNQISIFNWRNKSCIYLEY